MRRDEDAPVYIFVGMCHEVASKVDKIIPLILDWNVRVLHKIFIQGGNVVLKGIILASISG
jgi:hypothetical protein